MSQLSHGTESTRPLVVLDVDLTGSNLGPGWRHVRVEGEWPEREARQLAAEHYGVPIDQVSMVEPGPILQGGCDMRERSSRLRELESDPAGEQRDDELVKAHPLALGGGRELSVQVGGQTNDELPACFHGADSTTGGIDKASTARDTTRMPKMKLTVRMEIDVDQAAWRGEYGSSGSTRDVEDYLLNTLQQCPAAEAGGFEITGYAVQEA